MQRFRAFVREEDVTVRLFMVVVSSIPRFRGWRIRRRLRRYGNDEGGEGGGWRVDIDVIVRVRIESQRAIIMGSLALHMFNVFIIILRWDEQGGVSYGTSGWNKQSSLRSSCSLF